MSSTNHSKFVRGQYERDCNSNRRISDYVNTITEIDRKSDERRFCQKMKALMLEEEMEARIDRDRKLAISAQQKIQQEQNIVQQEKELHRRKYHENKMRQQVRETNQELKELEMKLRTGYISKALAAQRAEKEAILLQEKIEKRKTVEAMAQSRQKDEEYRMRLKEVEKKRKFELRKMLVEQINDKHQRKQLLYEEFLKEKNYIDEIIRRIYDEQLTEIQLKMEKQFRFKKDIEYLLNQKDIFNQRQQLESEEENQRIKIYLEERDRKNEEEVKIKKQQMDERFERAGQMGEELFEAEKKSRHREELLIELQKCEMNEADEQKVREQLELEIRRRIELRFVLDQQKMDLKYRAKEREEEDRRYREEQMILLAENDKLDQLSNEKRLRKKLEHRRAIEECLQAKRAQRAEEVAMLLKNRETDKLEEQRKQQIIEEERIKMLKEHATNLIGFLPSGIFRESDRQFLALPPGFECK